MKGLPVSALTSFGFSTTVPPGPSPVVHYKSTSIGASGARCCKRRSQAHNPAKKAELPPPITLAAHHVAAMHAPERGLGPAPRSNVITTAIPNNSHPGTAHFAAAYNEYGSLRNTNIVVISAEQLIATQGVKRRKIERLERLLRIVVSLPVQTKYGVSSTPVQRSRGRNGSAAATAVMNCGCPSTRQLLPHTLPSLNRLQPPTGRFHTEPAASRAPQLDAFPLPVSSSRNASPIARDSAPAAQRLLRGSQRLTWLRLAPQQLPEPSAGASASAGAPSAALEPAEGNGLGALSMHPAVAARTAGKGPASLHMAAVSRARAARRRLPGWGLDAGRGEKSLQVDLVAGQTSVTALSQIQSPTTEVEVQAALLHSELHVAARTDQDAPGADFPARNTPGADVAVQTQELEQELNDVAPLSPPPSKHFSPGSSRQSSSIKDSSHKMGPPATAFWNKEGPSIGGVEEFAARTPPGTKHANSLETMATESPLNAVAGTTTDIKIGAEVAALVAATVATVAPMAAAAGAPIAAPWDDTQHAAEIAVDSMSVAVTSADSAASVASPPRVAHNGLKSLSPHSTSQAQLKQQYQQHQQSPPTQPRVALSQHVSEERITEQHQLQQQQWQQQKERPQGKLQGRDVPKTPAKAVFWDCAELSNEGASLSLSSAVSPPPPPTSPPSLSDWPSLEPPSLEPPSLEPTSLKLTPIRRLPAIGLQRRPMRAIPVPSTPIATDTTDILTGAAAAPLDAALHGPGSAPGLNASVGAVAAAAGALKIPPPSNPITSAGNSSTTATSQLSVLTAAVQRPITAIHDATSTMAHRHPAFAAAATVTAPKPQPWLLPAQPRPPPRTLLQGTSAPRNEASLLSLRRDEMGQLRLLSDLTRSLSSSTSWVHVAQLVHSNPHSLNAISVAAAFKKLVKCCDPRMLQDTERPEARALRSMVQHLCFQAEQHLPLMGPREVTGVLYSLAALDFLPPPHLAEALFGAFVDPHQYHPQSPHLHIRHPEQQQPQKPQKPQQKQPVHQLLHRANGLDCAHMAWAALRLGWQLHPGQLQAVFRRLQFCHRENDGPSLRSLSVFLNSATQLGLELQPEQMIWVEEQLRTHAHRLNIVDVVNALNSLARLRPECLRQRCRMTRHRQRLMQQQEQQQQQHVEGHAVADLAAAALVEVAPYAASSPPPHPSCVRPPHSTPWMSASLSLYPQGLAAEASPSGAVSDNSSSNSCRMSVDAGADGNSSTSYSSNGSSMGAPSHVPHRASESTLLAILWRSTELMHHTRADEAAAILYSLARLRFRAPQEYTWSLLRRCLELRHDCSMEWLALMVWAAPRIRRRPSRAWQMAMLELAARRLPELMPSHLPALLCGLARASTSPSGVEGWTVEPSVVLPFVRRVTQLLPYLTAPRDLANVVWALARLPSDCVPTHASAFWRTLGARCCELGFHNFSPQGLANMLWGFARVVTTRGGGATAEAAATPVFGGTEVIRELVSALEVSLVDMNIKELSMTTWSLAQLRIDPGARWVNVAVQRAVVLLPFIRLHGLTSLIHSITWLKTYTPTEDVIVALDEALLRRQAMVTSRRMWRGMRSRINYMSSRLRRQQNMEAELQRQQAARQKRDAARQRYKALIIRVAASRRRWPRWRQQSTSQESLKPAPEWLPASVGCEREGRVWNRCPVQPQRKGSAQMPTAGPVQPRSVVGVTDAIASALAGNRAIGCSELPPVLTERMAAAGHVTLTDRKTSSSDKHERKRGKRGGRRVRWQREQRVEAQATMATGTGGRAQVASERTVSRALPLAATATRREQQGPRR